MKNSLNLPVDKLSLSTEDGLQNTIHVSCELMNESKHALPFDISHRDMMMKIAHDDRGNPIIFSVGTDQSFRISYHASGEVTGTKSIELDTKPVIAFDVAQNTNGSLALVYATKNKEGGIESYCFTGISNSHANEWEASSPKKIDTSASPQFIIDKVKIVTLPEDDESPNLLFEGKIGSLSHYATYTDGDFQVLDFAADVRQGIKQIESGFLNADNVVYALFDLDSGQSLQLIDQESVFDFSSEHFPEIVDGEKRYNCFATILGNVDNDSSDLYVATTSSIYLFPESKKSRIQKILTEDLAGIIELTVRMQGNHISVWALTVGNRLYYIRGEVTEAGYSFFPPILFREDVSHIAAVCPNKTKTNELLLTTSQGSSLVHYWQNQRSDVWCRQPVKEKGKETLINFEAYVCNFNFKDKDYCPRNQESVKITASEWCYATINGSVFGLDRDVPAEIPIDATGSLNIVLPASEAAPPSLYLEADFLGDQALNVLPNGKVIKGLGTVKSANDLKNAKTQDGHPIIDREEVTHQELEAVAQGIDQMHASAGDLHQKLGENTYAFFTNANDKYYGEISQSAAYLQFLQTFETANGFNFKWNIGDLLHKLEKAVSKTWEVIKKVGKDLVIKLAHGVEFQLKKLGETLVFIYKVGEKVFHAVMDQVDHLMRAIKSLLQTVLKSVLKTLVKWLGFLFNFDDAWHTHNVLSNLLTEGVEYGQRYVAHYIEGWKHVVEHKFDELEQELREQITHQSIKFSELEGQSLNKFTAHKTKDEDRPEQHHPGHNWGINKISHGGIASSPSSVSIYAEANDSIVQQFYDDVLHPMIIGLGNDIGKDFRDAKQLLENFNADNFYILISDLMDTVLDVLKNFVVGLLQFLEDLLKDATALMLNSPLKNFPLLNDIYEIIANKYDKKAPYTVVEGIAFLVSLCLNPIHKLVTGNAPFQGKASLLEKKGVITHLLGPIAPTKPQIFNNDSSIDYETVAAFHEPLSVLNSGLKSILLLMKTMVYIMDLQDEPQLTKENKERNLKSEMILFTSFVGLFKTFTACPYYYQKYKKVSIPKALSFFKTPTQMLVFYCLSQNKKDKLFPLASLTFDLIDTILDLCEDFNEKWHLKEYIGLVGNLSDITGDIAKLVNKDDPEKVVSALIMVLGEGISLLAAHLNTFLYWRNLHHQNGIDLKATYTPTKQAKLILDFTPNFAPVELPRPLEKIYSEDYYWTLTLKNKSLRFDRASLIKTSDFDVIDVKKDSISLVVVGSISASNIEFVKKISLELQNVATNINIDLPTKDIIQAKFHFPEGTITSEANIEIPANT